MHRTIKVLIILSIFLLALFALVVSSVGSSTYDAGTFKLRRVITLDSDPITTLLVLCP